jgi:hypothetical protein
MEAAKMSDKNFEELENVPQAKPIQQREIMEVKDEWPFWQRVVGNIVNALPTVLWAVVTVALLILFQGNAELVGLSQAYMNLVVPATAYGILSLSAGLTLISWFFPYFSYRRMMKDGTPIEKAACMAFWGLIAIALALVIASVA